MATNNTDKADEIPPEHDTNLPGPDPEASDALDRALLEATGGDLPEGVKVDPAVQAEAEAAEEKRLADEEETARKTAEEKRLAEEAAKGAVTDPDAAAKEEAEKKRLAEEAAKAAAPAKDKFDELQLPPYTKPKAAEAFANVKALARQEIEAARKEAAEARTKLQEQEEKLKAVGKLSPEVEKELSELREFRAKLDVEADPKFKEYDAKLTENVEAIYAKLTAVGTTKEVIEKIKAMGGPAELDWEAMADKLPSSAKRYIEGKLFENEDLVERKNKALTQAKAGAAEYVKSKAEASTNERVGYLKAVEARVAQLSPQVEWVNDKQIPAGAKPEERAEIEAHNKRASEIRATMKEAIENDSPDMKGLLVLGIAELQRRNSELAELKKSSAAEKAKLEKELTDTKSLLERIKNAGKSRLGGAPAPGSGPAVVKMDFSEDTGSALDRHLKTLEAEKKAKE